VTSPFEEQGPFAHSARPARSIPRQSYRAHLVGEQGVVTQGVRHALRIARSHPSLRDAFPAALELAAQLHDLGKLFPENQDVLRKDKTGRTPLPLRHEDPGCIAALEKFEHIEAWMTVYAHHARLPAWNKEPERGDFMGHAPGLKSDPDGQHTRARTLADLDQLLAAHTQTIGAIPSVPPPTANWTGLTRRLLLSCLVDADHTDTAIHYAEFSEPNEVALLPEVRLAALRAYVSSLPASSSSERDRLRSAFFSHCADQSFSERLLWCDAPVGTGKTTALAAHALRIAIDRKLDRVFIVLPFTNLVEQTVSRLRAALVLPGENAERVVIAHHHRADFSDIDARAMAQTWRAPIVVTTAVQFFEAVSSASARALRKLHRACQAAIIIDEAHAAVPFHLWPAHLKWFDELTRDWGSHVILASGTLPEFWLLPNVTGGSVAVNVPNVLRDAADLRAQLSRFESLRLAPGHHPTKLRLRDFPALLSAPEMPGPRLVVMNTVLAAAQVAHSLRQNGMEVFHLSTALAPRDREKILPRIIARLKDRAPGQQNWTLVATSCVEAGMDFSFASGLRERASLFSLLQLGGRVNRGGDDYPNAVLIDFVSDEPRWRHPGIVAEALTLTQMISDGVALDHTQVTNYLSRLAQQKDVAESAQKLLKEEHVADYPAVEKLGRVITADTQTVLVDAELRRRIESGERVGSREWQAASVQLWANKITQFGLQNLRGSEELFYWPHRYDPEFLGIMAAVVEDIDRFLNEPTANIL
jgi:CRISPR-associated endonuclease/helicase Cas3